MTHKTDKETRERLVVSGAGTLSDAELLALVIREGTEGLSAVQLAENILSEFSGSLSELASADLSRIRRAGGCGTLRAVSIAASAELARRIVAEKALTVNTISSKEDVVRLFAPLAELPHEEFWVIYLTSGGKILASMFQSVSPRTAGFNTVDLNGLSEAGVLLTIVLMFIGGSPGSTAGGTKTTTLAVLVLNAVNSARKTRSITVFKRKLNDGAGRGFYHLYICYYNGGGRVVRAGTGKRKGIVI